MPKVVPIRKWANPDEFMASRSGQAPKGDGVRRVTGSADIPLNAEGKGQAKELATSLSEKFDRVLTSPEKRAVQTAKEFGKPIELAGLDAWRRGSLEGKPVDATKGQVKFLMLNPDKRPLGKSAESGEPGESLNEFARPLLATVQAIRSMMGDGERVLVVSHGGNIQTLDAWLKAGSPEDLSFDHKQMAQKPYWSVVGKLFKIGEKQLKGVENNEDPGLYAIEHGSTDFNSSSKGVESKQSEAPAGTGGGPERHFRGGGGGLPG